MRTENEGISKPTSFFLGYTSIHIFLMWSKKTYKGVSISQGYIYSIVMFRTKSFRLDKLRLLLLKCANSHQFCVVLHAF